MFRTHVPAEEANANKPTAADVAASVRIPAAQQIAEKRLRVLIEQRNTIMDEIRDLGAGDRSKREVTDRLTKLHDQVAEVEVEIGAAKSEVRPLRLSRAKEIERLLASRRRDAAKDIQRGLDLIRAGLHEVACVANAIELAGGPHLDLPLGFNALHVERVAERYATEQ